MPLAMVLPTQPADFQSLIAAHRGIILKVAAKGCSHRESADVLGTSEGNVATRLGRIRQHLRRIAGTDINHGGSNDGNA